MTRNDNYSSVFVTPERFEQSGMRALHGPNGWLLFVACNAGIDFAQSVKNEYESMLKSNSSAITETPIIGTREEPLTAIFADSETCPRLPKYVTGSNAYVFQCCQDPVGGATVNENIQQLIQVVRSLRAHRAHTITVVTPYVPYSRQDKPTFMRREATLASLFADQLKIAGANIHLAYHPHTYSLHGFYEPEMQFVALSGLALFVDMFENKIDKESVVAVSTDAGGAKFTVHFANAMEIPYAIANKFRTGKDSANLLGVIGDLSGKKTALITDDETVTGTSLLNATSQLYKNFGIEQIYIAVSHMKLKKEHIHKFVEAHNSYGLKELHITDSIPQIPEIAALDFVKTHSIARRFAATINRMHYNYSVSELHEAREKVK